jgi:hypothetical protein
MVRVDVPYAEFLATKDHIIQMMKPNNTVMDLVSLARPCSVHS